MKIYQVNVKCLSKLDENYCFFFIYENPQTNVTEFMVSKEFPSHIKKHLSKRFIRSLQLRVYHWFFLYCTFNSLSEISDCLKQHINIRFLKCKSFSIQEYDV